MYSIDFITEKRSIRGGGGFAVDPVFVIHIEPERKTIFLGVPPKSQYRFNHHFMWVVEAYFEINAFNTS
ncbi:unnamed protein product [Ceratitis capitata]|uniref:(Mediterranean fruit fly) hypothetical protein n=1 Tax=Ceratitis capitata TaxID=7213 RepID=A0A811UDT5_CERCA|nr:unnamed protein product [Ceratitis capitata]